ncbi:sensor histidine kinase [uncultured Devosia sp.]|uniref:sensor histidine kinase n=1 Tax=uncultured Devosia sp. TaxID=211434 RepID=UPI0035C9A2E5
MTAPAPAGTGDLDWVLVLAPYRRDGAYLQALLVEHGMRVEQCAGAEQLGQCLVQSPGVIVATHEGLNPAVIEAIAMHLVAQPNWSELPIVILLDRAVSHARIRAQLSKAWPGARQTYYQRPVAALELVSGIQSALALRRRQREVRDYIDNEIEFRLELNHRVKNLLATVTSIFQMTRRAASSAEHLASDFEGRLTALANVHAAVFEAGGGAVPLADVVDLTLLPYRGDDATRIAVDGPDVTITREAGTTLALCLHELTTNAIKYGALSRPEGRLELRWTISTDPGPVLAIEWLESGGPPVSPPSRVGYGSRYIRSALTTLFGTPPVMDYAPSGLHCMMAGPLARLAAPPAPIRGGGPV